MDHRLPCVGALAASLRARARTDPSYAPLRVRLHGYTLFNLAADLRLTGRLCRRLENSLNERYEDVFSFTNPGATTCASARF
jgi:vitamin B12 transporter